MAKPKPKTGDRRETNQPLKIDRLPPSVHESILALRNQAGKTWQEIEELSALPVDKGGFVEWDNLPTPVLELFPSMHLPHSNLQRWYDLRVRQVQRDVLESSARAREIAQAFAKAGIDGADEAVINAARDQIMLILSEDGSFKGKFGAAKGLIALAEIMQTSRANDIKERKVSADERKLKLLEQREAITIKKMEKETEAAARKISKGELTLDDINKLRRNAFGLPPLAADGTKAVA
jgi:hypothetical protein